jgi:hypothetical protein
MMPTFRFSSALVAAAALFFSVDADARSFRVSQVPNGSTFNCQTCHVGNGGPRNAFGQQVEAVGMTQPGSQGQVVWANLCNVADPAVNDADGDGSPNSVELGDPDCVWFTGEPDPGPPASNPGDANGEIVCDETFDNSCTADNLTLCNADGVAQTLNCNTEFFNQPIPAPATCGLQGANGPGAVDFDEFCVGAADDGFCLGLTDDFFEGGDGSVAFACDGASTCVTAFDAVGNTLDDRCRPLYGNNAEGCAVGELTKGCVDNVATICVGGEAPSGAYSSAGAAGIDCTSFGGTCVENGTAFPACEVPVGAPCDTHSVGFTVCDADSICIDGGAGPGVCLATCDSTTFTPSCDGDDLTWCYADPFNYAETLS